jgi:hypothetical protein
LPLDFNANPLASGQRCDSSIAGTGGKPGILRADLPKRPIFTLKSIPLRHFQDNRARYGLRELKQEAALSPADYADHRKPRRGMSVAVNSNAPHAPGEHRRQACCCSAAIAPQARRAYRDKFN